MTRIVNGIKLDDFTIGYLETALWYSTVKLPVSEDELVDGCMNVDDDHPLHGISEEEHCDAHFGFEDFTVEGLLKACHDCDDFQENNEVDLSDENDEYAGHNFWLNRNGHGVGFWDGRYEKSKGNRLSDACKPYGEEHIWVNEQGKLDFM